MSSLHSQGISLATDDCKHCMFVYLCKVVVQVGVTVMYVNYTYYRHAFSFENPQMYKYVYHESHFTKCKVEGSWDLMSSWIELNMYTCILFTIVVY